MNTIVTVPLPLNLDSKAKCLYTPYLTYEMPIQKVKRMKNIFVTFSGFCLHKNYLIKECHHNYLHQYSQYLKEASLYYKSTIEDSKKLIVLDDDDTYLSIHHPWYNYYHWICESIFRIWLVRKELNKLILLLPKYYKNADFIMGSLKPFNFKKIFYIPEGKSLFVNNLCLPQIKPICDSYNPSHLNQVRNFYCEYVKGGKKIQIIKIDKLYVSRKFAGRRNIVNEDQLLAVIAKHGFKIFYPEKYTFLEQVAIFSNVKYLIGAHGSGLTNMLFMQKGTCILELHKIKTNELSHPSFLFWYMANALKINYYHQICETFGRDDYFKGDYIVDPVLFEQNIEIMLGYREKIG